MYTAAICTIVQIQCSIASKYNEHSHILTVHTVYIYSIHARNTGNTYNEWVDNNDILLYPAFVLLVVIII